MKKTLKKLLPGLGHTHFIDKADEYLNWLLVSNAGMQHKGNIHCFELAVSEMPAGLPVLEIGAHAGLSANTLPICCKSMAAPHPYSRSIRGLCVATSMSSNPARNT